MNKIRKSAIVSIIFALNPIILMFVLLVFGVPENHPLTLYYPLYMIITIPAAFFGFITAVLIHKEIIKPQASPLKSESVLNTIILIYITISLLGLFDSLAG